MPAIWTHALCPQSTWGLPTPPNSLSPTLPPNKANSPPFISLNLPLQPIDTDIDLHDSSDHTLPTRAPRRASPPMPCPATTRRVGAITPTLLAKHHLPDVLLNNGPMAIRYVLAQLTQTVPGFARIPPCQGPPHGSRAALESRSGGGLKGDVVFDKIGWGRWDARFRHQQRKERPSASLPEARDGVSRAALLSRSFLGAARRLLGIVRLRRPGTETTCPSTRWTRCLLKDAARSRRAHRRQSVGRGLARPTRRTGRASAPTPSARSLVHGIAHVAPRLARVLARSAQQAGADPAHKGSAPAQPRASSLSAFCQNARGISYSAGIVPFQYVYSSSLSSSRMQGVPDYGSSPQEREAVEALLRMGSM